MSATTSKMPEKMERISPPETPNLENFAEPGPCPRVVGEYLIMEENIYMDS